MGQFLVIVESPAKAKTINRMLGNAYVVKSSMGHVRDLPVKSLGVDIENGFQPKYVVVRGRRKVVDELKRAARDCEAVYLAPDPDREGEAIAWHLRALLGGEDGNMPFYRVQYNEITADAVRRAFAHPGELDRNRFEAQQARRILDRIVGYKVSPMLWRRIKPGLSAGRVQSVALRLVCERETEIRAFVPEPYWVLGARVRKRVDPRDPFRVRLALINGQKADVRSESDAAGIRDDLDRRALRVEKITRREIHKRPPPPFITSTLQQAASGRCGFSPRRTMALAQQLYEGVDLGDGPAGLITYMRTDSVTVAREAQQACRALIRERFGEAYCPAKPNVYRSRAGAQEAHEAIRPTDVQRTPDAVRAHLDPAQLKLYRLIWERFTASQMTPALIDQRTVDIDAVASGADADRYTLRATDSQVRFPGYMQASGIEKASNKDAEDGDGEDDETAVPPLDEGEPLDCLEWLTDRKETQPPPRYSEASLVRALEKNGVGRPSTYAQILSTLHQREYVTREKRTLTPTELGMQVNALLVSTLDPLFDVAFTASMEASLDDVEAGTLEWDRMLETFYGQFQVWMENTRSPAADGALLRRALAALKSVREWNPPVKNGKRTYSDERFVQSIERQLESGGKPVTERQLQALLRLAVRYRDQVPEAGALVREAGCEDLLDDPSLRPPRPVTLKKFELLDAVDLDEKARAFVESLRTRVEGGRRLTEAQARALDGIVLARSAEIPDFDRVKAELELTAPERAADEESGPLLDALRTVTEWKEPVTRGKRTFDDRAFYESLARHFGERGCLTERQRAALKKLVRRYAGQVRDFASLAERYGIGRKAPARRGKARHARR
ncbi:MAG: type I DNA topoisomerase [Lentisphaerae bacterium]|nr:type I DNA topoisomerase [Lentisphaerota bacterium]